MLSDDTTVKMGKEKSAIWNCGFWQFLVKTVFLIYGLLFFLNNVMNKCIRHSLV